MPYKITTLETTRYAFDLKVKITFDADGGTASKDYDYYVIGKPIGTLPTATKEGWNFGGWYDGETKITVNTVITGAMALKAAWVDEPEYFTLASTGTSTVSLNKSGSPYSITLYRRIDDGEWEEYSFGSQISLADGQSVSFKGDGGLFSEDRSNYYYFSLSGSLAASGSIMTLLDSTDQLRTLPNTNVFFYLFRGQSALKDASGLKMEAKTCEACYTGTFENCTGLTAAPELPDEDPAQKAYDWILAGCSNLHTVKVGFSTWPTNDACDYWLYNVSSTGVFTCPAGLPDVRGPNNIPSGWTIVNV